MNKIERWTFLIPGIHLEFVNKSWKHEQFFEFVKKILKVGTSFEIPKHIINFWICEHILRTGTSFKNVNTFWIFEHIFRTGTFLNLWTKFWNKNFLNIWIISENLKKKGKSCFHLKFQKNFKILNIIWKKRDKKKNCLQKLATELKI